MNLRVFYLTRRGLSDGYVAMMSVRSPLNCSAVELWYKIMLEIRNQSDLTENHIKRKAAGYQRLSSNWLWLLMAVSKPYFPTQYFCYLW